MDSLDDILGAPRQLNKKNIPVLLTGRGVFRSQLRSDNKLNIPSGEQNNLNIHEGDFVRAIIYPLQPGGEIVPNSIEVGAYVVENGTIELDETNVRLLGISEGDWALVVVEKQGRRQ